MNKTGIEYLDFSWNPLAMRCKRISEGCKNCWHLRMANRLAKNPRIAPVFQAAYAGKTGPVLVESRLTEPLKREKPAWIGVQFMGDLFHEDVCFGDITRIVNTMLDCSQHKFLVLTKRVGRLLEFVNWYIEYDKHALDVNNIWWGTSVENQETANERIPQLSQIPGKRWLSVEPMLERVNFEYEGDTCICGDWANHSPFSGNHTPVPMIEAHLMGIDWVTLGAETGPGARTFKNEWAADVLEQCRSANVPFFMKKVAGGKEPPPELMVREYPND